MPKTVDEFIKNFTSSRTMDDGQASQYFDRFTSNDTEVLDFDNQTMHLGVAEYFRQLHDSEVHQAAQPAFAQAHPAHRYRLLSSLMRALTSRRVSTGCLGGQLGLQSTNPLQMGPVDYARLANYARTNHPQVMQDPVQSEPWLVKAMG